MNVRPVRNRRTGEITGYKATVKHQGNTWYFTRDSQTEAEIAWADGKRDARNGVDPYARYNLSKAPKEVTLTEWLPSWVEAQNWERRTEYINGRIIAKWIKPRYGKEPAGRITHLQAAGFLKHLTRVKIPRGKSKPASRLAPATVVEIWGLFAAMMASAHAEGLVDRDPCLGLRPPKARTVRERHVLTPGQVLQLADAIAVRPRVGESYRRLGLALHSFVILKGFTGARWEEIAGLRPDAVRMLARPPEVCIREGEAAKHDGHAPYRGEQKSPAAERAIQIPRLVAEAAAPGLSSRGPAALVNSQGRPFAYSAFRAAFDTAAAACGHPEWTPHDLRHSHATWLQDCPRRAVQERLGHEPQDTTDIYTHVTDAHREIILDELTRLWLSATGAADGAAAAIDS
jgi:integrase